MKKSLLLLVALFTSLFAGAETIDNKTATWTATTGGITLTSGTYTLTAAKGSSKTAPQQHAKDKDVRVYAKGTLTIATTGSNMKSIVFKIARTGIFRQAEISASTGTAKVDTTAMTVTWTGDANNIVLTVGDKATYGREKGKPGQFRFIKAEISTDGSTTGGTTGGTTTTTDATIASLNALTANQANVRLKFTNAKVLGTLKGKKGESIFVREGDKAIILYGTGLTLADNAILNGYIDVDFKSYYGIPEVVKNANTNTDHLTVATSTDAADPVEVTIADLAAKKHVADLVVLKNVKIESAKNGKYTNYYAVSGSEKVQLFGGIDVKSLANNGKSYNVTAFFNQIFKGSPELATAKVEEAQPTGISSIEKTQNNTIYDLQGRRVEKAQKGLFIINGKKVLVK